MTEQEWLVCDDPVAMVSFRVEWKAPARQLRWFASAVCGGVELVEQYLLGQSDGREMFVASGTEIRAAGGEGKCVHREQAKLLAGSRTIRSDVQGVLSMILESDLNGQTDNRRRYCDMARCVFGNPFRPAVAEPSWLTSDVRALARGIYAEKAFDRLPILADALMDAGCDNEDVLLHCRQPGEHVRGCGVVELCLTERPMSHRFYFKLLVPDPDVPQTWRWQEVEIVASCRSEAHRLLSEDPHTRFCFGWSPVRIEPVERSDATSNE